MTKAMGKIPSTGRGLLELDVSLAGVEAEVGHRLSPHWTIGGYAGSSWAGRVEAGGRLTARW